MKSESKKYGLDDYMEILSSAFNLDLCLYDLCYFTKEDESLAVKEKLRIHNCPYCQCIKGAPKALDKCIAYEHEVLKSVPDDVDWVVKTCHAGLTQIIIPLRVKGKLMGGLFWGVRFLSGKRLHDRKLRDISRKFGLKYSVLKEAAETRPEVSQDELLHSLPFVLLLRDYILAVEKNISLIRNVYEQISRPDYRENYEKIDLAEIPAVYVATIEESVSPEIKKAVEFVKNNYWKNIAREDVSDHISMSPSHFSRKFFQETHVTFRKFLQNCLICAATYFLKQTDLSVEEISEKLGYSSSAALTRSFKKITGFSPRVFTLRNADAWWNIENHQFTYDELVKNIFQERKRI